MTVMDTTSVTQLEPWTRSEFGWRTRVLFAPHEAELAAVAAEVEICPKGPPPDRSHAPGPHGRTIWILQSPWPSKDEDEVWETWLGDDERTSWEASNAEAWVHAWAREQHPERAAPIEEA
jgi:hypothetical protein